jgi:hypothetical protein
MGKPWLQRWLGYAWDWFSSPFKPARSAVGLLSFAATVVPAIPAVILAIKDGTVPPSWSVKVAAAGYLFGLIRNHGLLSERLEGSFTATVKEVGGGGAGDVYLCVRNKAKEEALGVEVHIESAPVPTRWRPPPLPLDHQPFNIKSGGLPKEILIAHIRGPEDPSIHLSARGFPRPALQGEKPTVVFRITASNGLPTDVKCQFWVERKKRENDGAEVTYLKCKIL